MSDETWNAVDAHFEAALIATDAVLVAALRTSEAAGLPPIHVSASQGKFLQLEYLLDSSFEKLCDRKCERQARLVAPRPPPGRRKVGVDPLRCLANGCFPASET